LSDTSARVDDPFGVYLEAPLWTPNIEDFGDIAPLKLQAR
jgi:hypothetical protein